MYLFLFRLYPASSGSRSIETDLNTDREELFHEKDKDELKRELEKQVAGSIVSIWRQLQKNNEDDRFSMKSDASSSRTSPIPLRVKWSENVHNQLNGEHLGGDKKQSHSQSNISASKYRLSG